MIKNIHKLQQGFSAVAILLLLILITLVGFTGYYVWNSQKDKKSNNTSSVSQGQAIDNKNNDLDSKETLSKEICTDDKETCISYPELWQASASVTNDEYEYPTPVQKIDILNTASGSNLNYVSDITGLGGVCQDGDLITKVVKVTPKSDDSTFYIVSINSDDAGNYYSFLMQATEEFSPKVGESQSCAYSGARLNKNKSVESDYSLFGKSYNEEDRATIEAMIDSFSSTH